MNQGRVEDKKKARDDNIKSQMRQKWVRKFLENANESNETIDTKLNKLGESTISTQFFMDITRTLSLRINLTFIPVSKKKIHINIQDAQ